MLNRDIERELLPMAEAYGMTVATWSPLAHGILSGKHTRPDGRGAVSDAAPGSLGDRERAAARAVQEVADDVDATPAQVAIAWTRARSRAVHPILGASSAEQLEDDLGALDVTLPADALQRLDEAVEFMLGFPGDFIADMPPFVFGEVSARLDGG